MSDTTDLTMAAAVDSAVASVNDGHSIDAVNELQLATLAELPPPASVIAAAVQETNGQSEVTGADDQSAGMIDAAPGADGEAASGTAILAAPAPAASAKRSRSSKSSSKSRSRSRARPKPTSAKSKPRPKKSQLATTTATTRSATATANSGHTVVELDELMERAPQLSAREIEQEKQALAYRLLLKRPEFIDRRRAQLAEARTKVDSDVRRWPYIDQRNLALWEQEQKKKKATLIQLSDCTDTNDEQSNDQPMKDEESKTAATANGVVADNADDPMSDEVATIVNCVTIPVVDPDQTESEEEREDEQPLNNRGGGRGQHLRELSVRRRATRAEADTIEPATLPPHIFFCRDDDFGLVHCMDDNLFSPQLMIGNRCHFYDQQSSRLRDGALQSYDSESQSFSVRLDPTVRETQRGVTDAQLVRTVNVKVEEEFWEMVDVAWCKNPDTKSRQRWWPCQVVHLFRHGERRLTVADTVDDGRNSGSDAVLIHLLGFPDNFQLLEVPYSHLLPWTDGLTHRLAETNKFSSKSFTLSVEEGRWLYYFHSVKWLAIENHRKRFAANKLKSSSIEIGPESLIGRRISSLWETDECWYSGLITQYNCLTQSFCVLYDDHEVEWVNFNKDTLTLDPYSLPLSIDIADDDPPVTTRIGYYDYRLYQFSGSVAGDSNEAWLRRMDAIRRYQATLIAGTQCATSPSSSHSLPDPPINATGSECWECGLVDDVFLLSSIRGFNDKKREPNIECHRCAKFCHPRCYQLMKDRLEKGESDHSASKHHDNDLVNGRDNAPSVSGGRTSNQGWKVVIDKKKPPRCIDCLRCEHCQMFGARSTKPKAVDDENNDENEERSIRSLLLAPSTNDSEEFPLLRSQSDLLTCDVCDLRVHRQCLEPPFPESLPPVMGGWVCRQCLQCRSCHHTQAQFEQLMIEERLNPKQKSIEEIADPVISDQPDLMETAAQAETRRRDRSRSRKKGTGRSHTKKRSSDSARNRKRVRKPKAIVQTEAMKAAEDFVSSIVQRLVDTATDTLTETEQALPPIAETAAEAMSMDVDVAIAGAEPVPSPPSTTVHNDIVMADDSTDAMHIQPSSPSPTLGEPPVTEAKHDDSQQHAIPESDLDSEQLQPTASGASNTDQTTAEDTAAATLQQREATLVALAMDVPVWEHWQFEFTMCSGCTQRMSDREYCVICCGLWDEARMVQCDRCVRWVHIDCDESAKSCDADTLNKFSVSYHCPDCVKREKANEMIAILDALNGIDRHHYFLKPVTSDEAADYYETIKTPMDFTTIYNKLYSMSYKTLEQFKYDLNLVWRNAKDYNPPATAVHRTAVRLQQKSVELLEILRAKTENTELEQVEGRIEDLTADANCVSHTAQIAAATSINEGANASTHVSNEADQAVSAASLVNGVSSVSKAQRIDAKPSAAVPILSALQSQRDNLLAAPLDAFRFFYAPDRSSVFANVDCCLVCGSAGDSEHYLSCSECGELMHWFCVDIDMMRRAYRDPLTTGGARIQTDDPYSINPERLTGQWKCPNCADCGLCHLQTHVKSQQDIKKRIDDDSTEVEVAQSNHSVAVNHRAIVQCDLCDQSFHLDCLGPNFPPPVPSLPDCPPAPYRCDRCVHCIFCGTSKPGKALDSRWQLGYTACNSCAKLWGDGKYCTVCEKLWKKNANPKVKKEANGTVTATHSDNHAYTLTVNKHSHSQQSQKEEMGAMMCEQCDHWIHFSCDSTISRAEYELLNDSDFYYYCPVCRNTNTAILHKFQQQRVRMEERRQELERLNRLQREQELAQRDFLSSLVPPFARGLQGQLRYLSAAPSADARAAELIPTNIFRTAFTHSVDDALLKKSRKVNYKRQIQALSHEARKVETKRKRERRKVLIQQKRRARLLLPIEQRCQAWLELETEADCEKENTSTDASQSRLMLSENEKLAMIDAMRRQLLQVIKKQRALPSEAIVPMSAASFPPFNPPSVSLQWMLPEALFYQHNMLVAHYPQYAIQQGVIAEQPPKLETVTPYDAVNVYHHQQPTLVPAPGATTPTPMPGIDSSVVKREDSVTVKNESALMAPMLVRRRVIQPLPSPVLTLQRLGVSDPRVCFLCNKHGDHTDGSKASGRLLPADAFTPALTFVHVHCALWSGSMYGSTSESGAMSGVFAAFAKHRHTQCHHCGGYTASIQCRFNRCKKHFHFDCAVASGCVFTAETRVYCYEHAVRVTKLNVHEIVPIQRRMVVKVSSYTVTDGRLRISRSGEMRDAPHLVSGKSRARPPKRKKPSAWERRQQREKRNRRSEPDDGAVKLEDGQPVGAQSDEEIDDEAKDEALNDEHPEPQGSSPLSSELDAANDNDANFTVKSEPIDPQSTLASDSAIHTTNAATNSLSTLDYHQRIGSLTVLSLGSISSLHGFHSSHFIYPIGFHSYRLYWSYSRRHQRTGYHLYIESQPKSSHSDADGANSTSSEEVPLFRIVADDDPSHPIEHAAPSEAFQHLQKRLHPPLAALSHRSYSPILNAAWFFGFGLPPVLEQLEFREGSDRLTQPEYEFRYNIKRMEVQRADLAELEFQRARLAQEDRDIAAAMAVQVPVNASGCARLEGYSGKRTWSSKTSYKAGFGASLGLVSQNQSQVAHLELPHEKRRKNLNGFVDNSAALNAAAGGSSVALLSASQLTAAYRAMKSSSVPRAIVGHSIIHEWGLFAAHTLESHTMVVEYLGESIRQKVADVREKRYEETGIGSCYMFRIDADLIIDATKRGNIGRFINHSCDPNCVTRIIDVGGVQKIAVITNRKVGQGEEITYDYFFANEADRIACNCGARNCAGRLN